VAREEQPLASHVTTAHLAKRIR